MAKTRFKAKHHIWVTDKDTGKEEDVVIMHVEVCRVGQCCAVFARRDGHVGCDDIRHFRMVEEELDAAFGERASAGDEGENE